MSARVVTLGECLVSFVATQLGPLSEATTFERHIAGAEANAAVGLARLGHAVSYVGRVGDDGFGTAIRLRLRGEGIDTGHLVTDPEAPTGVMFRERRMLGPAQVLYARAGSAGSRLSADDIARAEADGVFEGARWLHLTGITPALSRSARDATDRALVAARAAGLTISFDVNLRRRLWSDADAAPVVRAIAARTDVVLGSVDELAVITGGPATSADQIADEVLELGCTTVVVKLGSVGALAREAGRAAIEVAGLTMPQILDPIGAGDAFSAGFIAARLDGADMQTALETANACGAAAVAAIGDMSGLPDRAELERLLATGGPDTLR